MATTYTKAPSASKKKVKTDEPRYSDISVIKNVDVRINGEYHKEYLHKIVQLVKSCTFIADGNDLCKQLGLKHESVGGDFKSIGLTGDVKFLTENSKVCLGGAVDLKTVMEQGSMIIIVYHPYENPNVGVYAGWVKVWSDSKTSTDEAIDLIDSYEKWHNDGRPNEDTTSFESENFFISLHDPAASGQKKDRFNVKAKFIKDHLTCFCKVDNYDSTYGLRARSEKIKSELKDVMSLSKERSVKYQTFILRDILTTVENKGFYIPKFQRGIVTTAEFMKKFIRDTIFKGESEFRGVFMFLVDPRGGYGLVDGRQRIYNAIYNFFVKGAKVEGICWHDICSLAKTDKEVEKFMNRILDSKFTARVYTGYSYNEMALEYRIANSGAQMNRQELRTSFNSRVNDVVNHWTEKDMVDTNISALGIKSYSILDEVASKKTLRDMNLPTNRMNIRSLISFLVYETNNWGVGFSESDDQIDKLYEDNGGDISDVVSVVKKAGEYLDTLTDLIEFNKNNPKRYSNRAARGTRSFRAKGYAIVNQGEWDVLLFTILELKNRNRGKKLVVTGDFISKVLENHYKHVESTVAGEYESYYGRSTRKEQRTWEEISTHWFPRWSPILDADSKTLESFGIKFE